MGHLAAPLAMPEAEIVLRAPAGVALPKVETIWFRTPDGLQLNFKHLPPATGSTDRGPVLLVHGSGVRANLFCPPSIITLPAMLSAEGFDVWMLNWRASIDVQPTEYTFDDAAAQDFPTATREILDRTGRSTLKAVVHCQGSHAFMMSMTAGLLPEYTRVVANSTALHPRIRRAAAVKLPFAMATLGRSVDFFNPQYGLYAPWFWPRLMDWLVRAVHHECRNPVCKHASFVYGVGFPTMWNHENLDEITHDWIKGEFAHVPVSLFRQTRDCLSAGHLVSTGRYRELPANSASDHHIPMCALSSSSSPVRTTAPSGPTVCAPPGSTSNGTRPGCTRSSSSPATDTSTCSSASTRPSTSSRQSSTG